MKLDLLKLLMFASKQAIYVFLVQVVAMQFLIAEPSNSQSLMEVDITLNLKNTSIENVFSEIEKHTEFNFTYGNRVKTEKVFIDLDIKNGNLHEVLELIASKSKFNFRRVNKTIYAIPRKNRADVKPIIEEFSDKVITGKILDAETNEALIGASVIVKGTNLGTITDFNGNFRLSIPDDAETLVFSYVGYEKLEVAIGNQTTFDIALSADLSALNEIVVVGYGIQKKADVTGSIGSVESKDFNKGVVANPGQLLQGKVAGVNVSNVSGEPGAAQDVIIRGVGSLRSGTTPLYVIDGFALDNSETGLASNPLNFINPQDIESIDVLKDASAAAIYGARAANGVIVITTKKGKSGRTQVDVNVSTAFSNLANKVGVFSADEFRTQVVAAGGTLDDNGADTDWQDELTRTAYSKNVNLALSGGANKFSYYSALGVDDQEGILRGSNLKRYSGRLNLNQTTLNDRLQIAFNLTANRTENLRADSRSIVSNMLQLNPTTAPYTDGEPTLLENMLNPFTREEIYSDQAVNHRILANIAPSIEIINGLTYKLNLGVDYSTTNRDVQYKPYSLLEDYINGSLNTVNTTNKNSLVENTLTYSLLQNSHSFTFLVGHTYQKTFEHQKSFNLEGFSDNGIDPEYQDQISGESTPTYLNTYAVQNELQSFFGRVNYGFDDKYLITATMRADGSSKFGGNNRYGYFPSVALGWNIMNEDFLSGSQKISNLKLRASWGKTGNQEIPAKITKLSYTDSKADNDTYPIDGTESSIEDYPYGTIFTRLANPDIQWEVSSQTNVGVDFGFFNNKLSGSLDYFNKVSENILLEVTPADPIQPTNKYWTNIPDMEIKNNGIELSLDYQSDLNKDFLFNIGGNLAYTNNEVVNSPYKVLTTGAAQGAGQTDATINGNINGERIGSFYMQEFTGIGEDGLSILSDDRRVVGSALPDMIYAFYINLQYKNFDLGFNFNGVSGNKVYNHTAMSLFTKGLLVSNFNTTDLPTQYPNEDFTNSNSVSTRYLENGSFLRLNNATLGYNLKPSLIGLDGVINTIRLSLTGQNLFVISDYSGYDPEINSNLSLDGIQTFGIDYFNYPKARTILISLNVSF
ncbi:SusC/RagA family TonB-linked outer membrane protein [Chondrinema litorale]|uniref:SusC/RagA family TonB-linked outer membrane protein n=1 Tax=Chondrinema litorale TaxID=2994555 RepID=UPI0025432CE4|nr:SusC/RagA family TonB-linked outer membrane protein [Chondrinema litorale]UZR98397.1 SusC/RagA family TonB-linked outer membrane protein [Chondrinema litorale]